MTFKGIISYGPETYPSYIESQSTFNNILASPLDGVVVSALTNSGVNLSTDCWNTTRTFTIDSLSDSIATFEARRSEQALFDSCESIHSTSNRAFNGYGKCRYNFVKLQISGATILTSDPFDSSFNVIFEKLCVLGEFAARAGFYGIWFDVEGYIPIWTYDSLPNRTRYSLEDYQERYYEIGVAISNAWRTSSRDLSIMVTSAYEGYVGRLPDVAGSEWGLYKNFLDGLFDGFGDYYYDVREGSGKIILTTEGTYGLTNTANLVRYGVHQMNGTFDSYTTPILPPSHAGNPAPDDRYWGDSVYFYDDNIREIGLALWIDKPTFDPLTPNSNYWTPSVFASALQTVIQNCEWCWIYNPLYSFYDGLSGSIPSAYLTEINAVRSAEGLRP